MNKPRFTIATVTYNAAATIERTLHSVAQQDYPWVEHLIIDGCSSDGTLQIIRSFDAAQEPSFGSKAGEPAGSRHIRLISERDKGLYDAMNKALRLATGHYIVFLNAGDTFPSASTLSLLAAGVRQGEEAGWPAILYGQTDIVDNEGRFLRHRHYDAPEVLTFRCFLRGMLVCHQAFYVRTDLAREVPYDLRYRYSADYDWCIRLIREAEERHLPIHNSHLLLAHYLSEGLTTQHHRASLWERMCIMGRHYGWIHMLITHFNIIRKKIWKKFV